MNEPDISEALGKAAEARDSVEPALLQRIADAIQPTLQAVRPLPRTWVLVSALMLIGGAVALGEGLRAGLFGFAKMDVIERVAIFFTLFWLACVAGTEFVNSMVPGSRRRIAAGKLGVSAGLLLLCVFALFFRDYHTEHFVSAGLLCLVTGVLHAIPVGLMGWLLLRRGVALNRISAGITAGTFAGLAGIALLELHCANFQALHILVWHTAVLPVSVAVGVIWARVLQDGKPGT